MKYSLDDIRRLIAKSTYSFNDGWFFPSDLIPHATSLKYSCKKLYEQGKLERSGGGGRWGYQYRIK